MTTADIVFASAFVGVVLIGILATVIRDVMKKKPKSLIRIRALAVRPLEAGFDPDSGAVGGELFRITQHESNNLTKWLRQRVERIVTVAGSNAVRNLSLMTIAIFCLSVLAVRLLPMPVWVAWLIPLVIPPFAAVSIYKMLIKRFRGRFLEAFPESLDLIVRAVRAGVPASLAIGIAGQEAKEPVRAEFQTMGNALKLGIDLNEVLAVAVDRLQIADFAFFAVCLTLQRETGGQLGETLENLAQIIRTRRDIRLKTKALTGEARVASKIIAAVPFCIMGALYVLNKPYLEVLFNTPSGNTLLETAMVMLAMGLYVIGKMARLETSR
jgi:tight adherence protein B